LRSGVGAALRRRWIGHWCLTQADLGPGKIGNLFSIDRKLVVVDDGGPGARGSARSAQINVFERD